MLRCDRRDIRQRMHTRTHARTRVRSASHWHRGWATRREQLERHDEHLVLSVDF